MELKLPSFKKSSFSPAKAWQPGCVAVSISSDGVLVTDTKNPGQVLSFTILEWDAFIKGVKNCEFDIE